MKLKVQHIIITVKTHFKPPHKTGEDAVYYPFPAIVHIYSCLLQLRLYLQGKWLQISKRHLVSVLDPLLMNQIVCFALSGKESKGSDYSPSSLGARRW